MPIPQQEQTPTYRFQPPPGYVSVDHPARDVLIEALEAVGEHIVGSAHSAEGAAQLVARRIPPVAWRLSEGTVEAAIDDGPDGEAWGASLEDLTTAMLVLIQGQLIPEQSFALSGLAGVLIFRGTWQEVICWVEVQWRLWDDATRVCPVLDLFLYVPQSLF